MNNTANYDFIIFPEVAKALEMGLPIVALESTILAHGMPYPQNLEFAQKAIDLVRQHGAIPATIAILAGQVHIGLSREEIKTLTTANNVQKTALRDIPWNIAQKLNGATTVSATMHLAHLAGINVFATGGIGGVHRDAENTFDVSQDLLALSSIPMLVVSAGAKAILDLPKTLEALETLAVTVLGYQTKEFPAFYSCQSGLFLEQFLDSAQAIATLYQEHRRLNLQGAILVANPVPKENEIPAQEISEMIEQALKAAKQRNVFGKALTP
ncbi:MAG: pseudouridine-5'-phosphate glycosidase, partial [Myxococcota bacterium]|nr:pseudouridine-5'-phosphate glycosidase [Myxococcota bacterium]